MQANETCVACPVFHNCDNQAIYNYLPLIEFQNLAEQAGLATNPDIECLRDYIVAAKDILEVGPGYGRIIAALAKSAPHANITGIERNQRLYQHLKQCFPTQNFLLQDVLTTSFQPQYELILLLWSFIAEFSPLEQARLVCVLAKAIKRGGHIAIETIMLGQHHPYANVQSNQYFEVSNPYGTDHFYVPTLQEIEHYARLANLSFKKVLNYAARGVSRVIYILG